MNHKLKRLYFSYAMLFTLQLIFYASNFIKSNFLSNFVLATILISTVAIYIILKSNNLRLVLFVFIGFASPMLSYPISDDQSIISQVIANIAIPSDRIQIKVIIFSLFSLMFFTSMVYLAVKKNAKILLIFFGFFLLLSLVLWSHSYEGLSIYQILIDMGYFIGAGSIVIYFRISNFDNQSYVLDIFLKLFKIFSIIVIVDLLLSFLHIVPWSTSYRGGLQGVLYAFELPYAYVIGLVGIYIVNYTQRPVVKLLIFLIIYFILEQTNIKSAEHGFLLALIITNLNIIRTHSRYIINKYTIAVLVVLIYWNINYFVEVNESFASRLGTYIAYYNVFFEGNNMFGGIMPGVTSFFMPSNLSLTIFDYDIVQYLMMYTDTISEGIIAKSKYHGNQGFLPHNVIMMAVASYGIIMAIPFFYYFIILPYKVVRDSIYINSVKLNIIVGFVIFNVIIGFTHPYMSLIEAVFFGELCRKFLSNKVSRNEFEFKK